MYLHRLEFQAIGPFAGREVVDLDALEGDGIFLLQGPTGSGKSTVIDALTFALFGDTAGAASSKERLRSAHVAPQVESFVDLVLSTAAGAFRIRRTPAYERPKLRGSGTTLEKATAKLWRLSPDELDALASRHETGGATGGHLGGELLASAVSDAAVQIAQIVGLTREQFTQTVVLPQGEFATFLRSSSDEREKILQRIFGTKIYKDIQAHLVAAAGERRKELAAAQTRMETRAGSYVDALRDAPDAHAAGAGDAHETDETGGTPEPAAGAGDVAAIEGAAARLFSPDPATAAAGGEALTERTTAIDARGAAHVASLADARQTTRTALTFAERHEQREERLAENIARRAALLERSARHEGAREKAEARAAALDAAERAARVLPFDRVAGDAARAVEDARQDVADALPAAAQALPDVDAAGMIDAPVAELEAAEHAAAAEVERLDRTRGELDRAHALEQGLPARQSALDERSAALDVETAALAARRAEAQQRPAQRSEMEERRAAARARAGNQAQAATTAQAAAGRLAAAREAHRARTRVEKAEEALRVATEQAIAAQDAAHALRRRRIEGIAGELAQGLVDGAACSVCGSVTHPAPARPAEDHPSAAQVEEAETAQAEAAAGQTRARSVLDVARTTLEDQIARAEGLTLDAATEAAQAADAALAEVSAADEEASRLEADLAQFDERTAQLEREDAALDKKITETSAQLSAERTALDEDRRTCATARGQEESVAARVRSLDGARRAVARFSRACAELARARLRDAAADAELAGALAEAGFGSVEEAREATVPDGERTRLRAAVEAHRTEGSVLAQSLAAPEVAALTGKEVADTESARRAVAAAREADEAALAAVAAARRDARNVEELGAALVTEAASLLALRAEGAALVRMANLASAATGSLSQVTLGTWVLMRRFEDMLAAANGRLRTMSAGRYELRRSDRDEGQRARHAGLGLVVADHQTEAQRPPATLSGGETFYVSLALALGLADVVRAEAGGIEIGTLLIDEGFGSLDQETLDVVMDELTRLRDGGRTVGLVSHVTEMKRMISDQIRVCRAPSGGSTLQVNWMR